MLKELFQYVVGLAPAKTLKVYDREYTDKKLDLVVPPRDETVKVHRLSALRDLVKAGVIGAVKDLLAHVVSFAEVQILERETDLFGKRTVLAAASPESAVSGFEFGKFYTHEAFQIALQSQFTEAGDRDYLLRVAANLTNEHITASEDDGVTQRVGLKKGVALKTTEIVRPLVDLAPYRTFREVEQPASRFLFRVRQDGLEEIPKCALFEADGGAWRLTAVDNIARYLSTAIDGVPVIS